MSGPDATSAGPDAGTGGVDAETADPDAGVPQPDGGAEDRDTGVEDPDGGVTGPDAGEEPDAAVEDPDAAVANPDAGTNIDAGQDSDGGLVPDAGLIVTVPQALQRLATRTVFFHHMSVGHNIVAGIQDHLTENPGSGVTVVQTRTASALVPGTFAHADLAAPNGSPFDKIVDFHAAIDSGLGTVAQIAFMKLCFADFWGSPDVNSLFTAYRSSLAQLKADYPAVRFVHVTSPLVVGDDLFNVQREAFNTLMRNAYAGTEPVFDLARAEATCPDGSVTVGTYSGVIGLCPAYSEDGGHLNATGRKTIARSLLLFLASLP